MPQVLRARRALPASSWWLAIVSIIVTLAVPAVANATTPVVTPEIVTIFPDQGALTGGEEITITGTNFNRVNGSDSVLFGGSEGSGGVAGAIAARTDTSLTVIVPRGLAVGAADVTLVTSDVRVTRQAGYRYLQPTITAVSPSSGPTAGGRRVTITGYGFGFTRGGIGNSVVTSVLVRGVPATSVTRVDETSITATMPAGTAGPADVEVTITPTPGDPVVITGAGLFNYVVAPAAPTITSINPSSGTTAGGNAAVVTGTNLRGSDTQPAVITFGTTRATVLSVSGDNTQATVTVPPGAAGSVDVIAQTSDGRAVFTNGYTYGVPPVITAITPPSGPQAGGTRIVIDGANFGTSGTPAVIIGGTAAQCVERNSDTRITAVVPPGTLGGATVIIATQTGGGSVTRPSGFTYVVPTTTPTITYISPPLGPIAGGTPITITGTGFTSANTPTVQMNGLCAVDVTVVDDSTITAITPASAAGNASVKITTSTGSLEEPASAGRFQYVSITGISPAEGPVAGGTTITITGSGFGSAPSVTVGGAAATVSASSSTSITAVTPPGLVGPRDVIVTPTESAHPVLTSARGFRYVGASVTSVTPASGVLGGGTTVSVVGTGFGNSGTPTVTFAGRAASNVNRISSTLLTAVTPAGLALGPVTVVVTPEDGGAGSKVAAYTYVPAVRTPLIDSLSPGRGPNTGGTVVTVTGSNFRGSNGVAATVRMGGVNVSGLTVALDGRSLSFTAPVLTVGSFTLAITTNEGTASLPGAFTTVGQPTIGGGGGGGGTPTTDPTTGVVSGGVCDAVSPNGLMNYNGNNQVTITGEGIRPTSSALPAVAVNGTAASVSAASYTSITFTIPQVAAGLLSIVITPEDGVPITVSNCIRLRLPLTVTAVATPDTIYFGDPSGVFTVTTSGLQPGDAVSSATLVFTPTSSGVSLAPNVIPTAGGVYEVMPSNAVFTSGSASNYYITYVPTIYTILAQPFTVTADDVTVTYGDVPTFTSFATGLNAPDALGTVSYLFRAPSATISSATVPTDVGTYVITPVVGSLSPGNLAAYSVITQTGTLTIVRKPVTVTADPKTKVFGQDDPAFTYSVSPAPAPTMSALTGDLGRAAGQNVGTYAFTQGSVTNANNPNYDITFVSDDLTITQATVTVTPDTGQTKVYGNNDPTLTYSKSPDIPLVGALGRDPGEDVGTYTITLGTVTDSANYTVNFVSGRTFSITARPITVTPQYYSIVFGDDLPTNSAVVIVGSLAFDDTIDSATYTYSTNPPVNAGTYTVSMSNLAFTTASALNNYTVAYQDGQLEIRPAVMTVTPDSGQFKVYGDNNPTYTYTTSSARPLAVTLTGALDRAAGEDVGSYQFNVGTLATGTGNVTLQMGGGVTFSVTRLPVTVSATATTKEYGDPDRSIAFTFTPSGTRPNGTTVTISGSPATTTSASTDAGIYPITQGTLTNVVNPNYEITFEPADLTITPVTVTVSATPGQSKVYGDDDPATFTYTTAPYADMPLDGALARDPGDDVGIYNITQGSLVTSVNYTVIFEGATFSVTARPVTISAENQESVYGAGALPSNTATVSGGTLAYTDTLGTVTFTYSITPPVNAGTHDIIPSAAVISGGRESNYAIGYENGTLTIVGASATVSANDLSIQFGDSPTFAPSDDGLLGSDELDTVVYEFTSDTYGPSTTPPTDVGEYTFVPVTVTSLSPGLVTNYQFTYSTVSATFTITPRPVTVTADPASKAFGDDDPAFTFSVSPTSTPNGTTVTVSGTLTRDNPSRTSVIGTYSITQGTVTDANNPNYAITYVPALLTVTAGTVTVSPTPGQSKPAGSTDPVLTYTTTPDVGLLPGLLGRAAGENPGTYAINLGTITNTADYVVVLDPTVVNFTVEPRTITITVDSHTIPFGEPVPANAITVPEGLITGDSLGGTPTYTYEGTGGTSYAPSTTPPSVAGTYSITVSGVTLVGNAANYVVNYAAGTLTIAPAQAGALFPDRGTYLGGTVFTITGRGFGPPGSQPAVTFGGQAATGVVLVDNGMITGVTPAFTLADEFTEELVDVVVTVTDGGSSTLTDAYTYLPPRRSPVMMTLFPDSGPTSGGTELTITGEHLGGSNEVNPTVFVNGAAASGVTVGDDGSVVTALTPPGPPGSPRDVELFTNEGATGFLNAFTYIPVPVSAAIPVITEIIPPRAYTVGGVPVVINGSGFGNLLPGVTVNGVRAQVQEHNSTSITIVLPPGQAGPAVVTVFPPASPVGPVDDDGFSYVATPTGDARGLLWLDLDKNGRYDPATEAPLPNLPVVLELSEYVLPPLDTAAAAQQLQGSGTRLASVSLQADDAPVVIPSNRPPTVLNTDRNGRYRFEDLPFGNYRLRLQLPGELEPTYLPPGSVNGLVQFAIEGTEVVADAGGAGTATLLAYVADQQRTVYPTTDVDVRWWGPDARMGTADDVVIGTRTGDDGSIQFRRRLPAGQYRVERVDSTGRRYVSNTFIIEAGGTLSWEYFVLRALGDPQPGSGDGTDPGTDTGTGTAGDGSNSGPSDGSVPAPSDQQLPSTGSGSAGHTMVWALLIVAFGLLLLAPVGYRTRRR